jgi:hypothetical protein
MSRSSSTFGPTFMANKTAEQIAKEALERAKKRPPETTSVGRSNHSKAVSPAMAPSCCATCMPSLDDLLLILPLTRMSRIRCGSPIAT